MLVITVGFNLPMRFEDVRDMDGDRRIGRTTLPLIVGHWPVRIWFAVVMTVLPVALHLLLLVPSRADGRAIAVCSTVIAAMSWTAAVRSVLVRTRRADRTSYLLYTFTYAAALDSALVLL